MSYPTRLIARLIAKYSNASHRLHKESLPINKMLCNRECLNNPTSGDITVDYNPSSGAIFIEFERFDSDDEVILPQYRVSLSTEHVAAWVESLLTNTYGRKCRRFEGDDANKKRLHAMLKLTQSDSNLVFCTYHGPHIILVRNGCVLKVVFGVHMPIANFFKQIKEECTTTSGSTAEAFVSYVQSLML